jgi:3-phenylpropionate/cinnamic acid dioxygenase small subunit
MTGTDHREIECFLMHEARLLDERRFDAWMELFTEDGVYWVPARPGQESPNDESSLFYDDRRLMTTRIARLNHPGMHSQNPPSRCCHLISNVLVEQEGGNGADILVTSNAIMVEYRQDDQRLFAGKNTHKLVRVDGEFRIKEKKVELINCDAAFAGLAVPI